jgi:hypothetical protein
MSSPESSYLTLSQVAVRTGRHPELLRQWCAAGRMPCARVGASWVMLERDVALLDGIASRARRSRASEPPAASLAAPVAVATPDRVLAAVFEDEATARLAAQALRDRLGVAAQEVGTVPLAVPALPALSLTVVAGRIAGSAATGARRILAAFGGRIVADVEEIRAATEDPAASEWAGGGEPAGPIG